MATTQQFHDYVMDRLCAAGPVTSRKMMGEYCVYYNGKLIGDMCDNMLLLKPTDTVLKLMPDADRAYPYEGSKTLMVIMDQLENTELLEQVLEALYNELPEPKKRGGKKEKAK